MRNKIIRYISCILFLTFLFGALPFENMVRADGEHTVTIITDQPGCQVEYKSAKYSSDDTFTAAEGDNIMLYARASDDYAFDYAESDEVTIVYNGSIGRYFTMPACDVTVTFHFTSVDPYACNLKKLDLGEAMEGYSGSDCYAAMQFEKVGTGTMTGNNFSLEFTSGDVDAFSITLLGGGTIAGKGTYNAAYIAPTEGLTAGTYSATATLYYDADGSGDECEKAVLSTATVTFTVNSPDIYHTLTVVTDLDGCMFKYDDFTYDGSASFQLVEGKSYNFYAVASEDCEFTGFESDYATVRSNGSIGITVVMPDCDATLTIHFNSTIVTGWQEVDGNTYFYDENGVVVTGWQKIDDNWFFFDKSTGVMQTGWHEEGDQIYYLDPVTGVMSTAWTQIDSLWYYFGNSGAMQFGWQKIGGKWYFFDTSLGIMSTGWKELNNKWYYFGSSGAMQTGWKQIKSKWYYFGSSGAMATGWQKIGKSWYYFNDSGVMQTGWKKISNKWYFFTDSGVMKTGWYQEGNNWYYFNASGVMVTGSLKIGNKTYNFSSSGVCLNP